MAIGIAARVCGGHQYCYWGFRWPLRQLSHSVMDIGMAVKVCGVNCNCCLKLFACKIFNLKLLYVEVRVRHSVESKEGVIFTVKLSYFEYV